MHSKKGVVEIQFNWIFVLIAGAIIISIFTTIIVKQKDISQASADSLLIKSIDAIISGSESIPGTVKQTAIPKTKIEFRCNGYSIGDFSKQFNAMNVFAPSVLEGNSIITLTLDWNVPYRVASLVYLTSPRIRYVFIMDSDDIFANAIFDMIPGKINKEKYIDIGRIPDKNGYEARIIFFNPPPSGIPDNLKGAKKITALQIDKDRNAIQFFNDEFKPTEGFSYAGEPTLLGAIFTDDPAIYKCSMKNAFKKLNIVSEIYQDKIDKLKITSEDYCKPLYNIVSTTNIIDKSKDYNLLDNSKVTAINNAAKELEIQNYNLLKKSCPLIY